MQLVNPLNDAKGVIDDRPRDETQRPVHQDAGHVATNARTPGDGKDTHSLLVDDEALTVASRVHRN